jgi:KH domain-containing protein
MAATGENYTTARRMVIARRDPGRPAVALRVPLNQYVDLSLTGEMARAYAAADEQSRRDMVNRLLANEITASASGNGQVTVGSEIVTDEELRTEAEDAAIRAAVQRGIERAVGVAAVEVDRIPDRVRVTIRAARPIVLAGSRGQEADRLRGELVELTGKRVQLDIRETSGPLDAASAHTAG